MRILSVALLLLSSVASAATPSEGVALKVRRGFFTETDVGAFFTLGGKDAYSNFQSYLQLGVGYDIGENIEVGVHFGIGASAQNCFIDRTVAGVCIAPDGTGSDNFTVTFLNASVAYLFQVLPRFYVAPKLTGGYTLLEPAPIDSIRGGANLGVGVGIEYATQMDHFSVGLDVVSRLVLGPNIVSMQIYPRVKYTF
ncbi:MAG: adventurous gliding motility protein CglE [Myxococcaceae bacterium]